MRNHAGQPLNSMRFIVKKRPKIAFISSTELRKLETKKGS